MAGIASARRSGLIDDREAQKRVRNLDMAPRVYDGANLEKAVRVLLKHVGR